MASPTNFEKIWNDCVDLLDSTEKKSCDLGNGETLTYREYNTGASEHTLVLLPGAGTDGTFFSYLAILDELKDHHIFAINPRGYGGSTNHQPNFTHEENAEDVKLFLDQQGITSNVVAEGWSTGGPACAVLALRYPDLIKAAVLLNAVPLDGMRWTCWFGKEPTTKEEVKSMCVDPFVEMGIFGGTLEQYHASFKGFFVTIPEAWPPIHHPLVTKYLYPGNLAYTVPWESQCANTFFNICPIQTPTSPPSLALKDAKENSTKIIVIHGKDDKNVPTIHVKSVTNLAIAEGWAPAGTISYYEHPLSHMGAFEDPVVVTKLYLQALEEHVLSKN